MSKRLYPKRNIGTVPVDASKLRSAIDDRGLTIQGAGLKCGFSTQFFFNILSRGYISKQGMEHLENDLGITYEEIKPGAESKPKSKGEKKMPRTILEPIDGTKLNDEIIKRGLSRQEISREMGFDVTYITNAVNRNSMRKSGLVLLDRLYNIKYDDIKPVEPEPEPEEVIEEHPIASETMAIPDYNLNDIFKELVEIKVALNKIGALQAELLKTWAPKG